MNIKILAALSISVTALTTSPAFADDHGWHGRGYRGDWGHEGRHGRDSDRWDGRHEAYRALRWNDGYAPRYSAPRYCPPRYYAPTSYYAPAYRGGWSDDLGVVIQLHLP